MYNEDIGNLITFEHCQGVISETISLVGVGFKSSTKVDGYKSVILCAISQWDSEYAYFYTHLSCRCLNKITFVIAVYTCYSTWKAFLK